MSDSDKEDIPGKSGAQTQIIDAVEFLCSGKIGVERAEIIDEVVALVRGIGRGQEFKPEADQLLDRDEFERESWARSVAQHLIDGALNAVERLPISDRSILLREMAKRALWHTPDSRDEILMIKAWLELENLRAPHPQDMPPPRD